MAGGSLWSFLLTGVSGWMAGIVGDTKDFNDEGRQGDGC